VTLGGALASAHPSKLVAEEIRAGLGRPKGHHRVQVVRTLCDSISDGQGGKRKGGATR
jgi:hypothetical protein